MIAARVGAALFLALGLQACGCTTYSNRLFVGHCPPKIAPLDEHQLLAKPNKEVSCFARALGIVTTPFKRLGIFGWRDMRVDVVVVGDVKQAVVSTDHFVTVDLRLLSVIADGQPVALSSERYLRAEVCERQLALPPSRWPRPGDRVRISGLLMWDGDGFLEVHPQRVSDVEILHP